MLHTTTRDQTFTFPHEFIRECEEDEPTATGWMSDLSECDEDAPTEKIDRETMAMLRGELDDEAEPVRDDDLTAAAPRVVPVETPVARPAQPAVAAAAPPTRFEWALLATLGAAVVSVLVVVTG